MAAPASTFTTAEELLRMPRGLARHELVRGELRVMCLPGARHGRLVARIVGLLETYASQTGCGVAFGELGFLLSRDPDTVRGPDAAFISTERFEAVGDTTKYWPGPPDLAVEVVSPNDTFREVREKALEWVASGCVAVLVVDPEKRTATVHRAGGESHVYAGEEKFDVSDAVPGFSLAADDLFC